MVWVVLLLAILYACLLGIAAGLWIYYRKNKTAPPESVHHNSFSLLIPFRNEVDHLKNLTDALSVQTLDRAQWECIFIDDHSQDQGSALLQGPFNFKSRLIPTSGEGKKAAIISGCSQAKSDFIIQTDADGLPASGWLSSIAIARGNQSSAIITGPVAISNPKTLFDEFQSMDMMALMGMTFAGIKTGWWHMGNGANLAYPKSLRMDTLSTLRGDIFASGDDMFLIEYGLESKKTSLLFNFNPDGIVFTSACTDLKSFLNQRLRWATKNASMKSLGLKTALGITTLFNLLLIFILIEAIFNPAWILFAIFIWIQKWVMDYFFLRSLSTFFNQRIKLFHYVICAAIYPFYSLFILVLSIFKRKYEWKGRIVQ